MSIEAMKQALEALVSSTGELHLRLASPTDMQLIKNHQAITSLRQAIAEAQKQIPPSVDLNTHQQAEKQRQWVRLTDEEVFDVWLNEMPAPDKVFYQKLCRSVEAKLKEKNT